MDKSKIYFINPNSNINWPIEGVDYKEENLWKLAYLIGKLDNKNFAINVKPWRQSQIKDPKPERGGFCLVAAILTAFSDKLNLNKSKIEHILHLPKKIRTDEILFTRYINKINPKAEWQLSVKYPSNDAFYSDIDKWISSSIAKQLPCIFTFYNPAIAKNGHAITITGYDINAQKLTYIENANSNNVTYIHLALFTFMTLLKTHPEVPITQIFIKAYGNIQNIFNAMNKLDKQFIKNVHNCISFIKPYFAFEEHDNIVTVRRDFALKAFNNKAFIGIEQRNKQTLFSNYEFPIYDIIEYQ